MRNRKANQPNQAAENARKAMLRRNKKGGMDEGTKYTIAIGGFVVVMLVVVLYMVLNPKESILNRQVNDVNEFLVHNNHNQFFKQGENEQFEGYTIREAQKFFNIGISDTPNLSSCPAPKEPVGIPPSYDFRTDEDRKACVGTPRQTGNCTAGHVLSVVSAVEDRICIANGATERLTLSAQDAVSCDTTNYYCDGGYVKNTLDYGTNFGFVTEECFPWKGDNTTCPAEPNKCRENKEQYNLMGFCVVQGPEEIKREILENGPVIAPMGPFTDLLSYKEGTYVPSEGSFKFNGQHVVKIVGWESGPQGSTWIIENSWGPTWGEDGYAQVISGHKDLGIDFIGLAPQPIPMPAGQWETEAARMQEEWEKYEQEQSANDTEAINVNVQ